MNVKATTNFCGAITMAIGEVRNISDDEVVKDLVSAGYVVSVDEAKPEKAVKNESKRNNA